MSRFVSGLASTIESLLAYRAALGYCDKTHFHTLLSLDKFFAQNHLEADRLTQATVMEWLAVQSGGFNEKATAVRILGRYLSAMGKESYVLPTKFIQKQHEGQHMPYIFSDSELKALFQTVDTVKPTKKEPFIHELLPVMLRLIYTCGLRPNEGRELKCENVNLQTGEILITDTKGKKDRLVVMSTDMLRLCCAYDKRRAVFSKHSPFFFPSWKGDALTSLQVTMYFRDCWFRAFPNAAELPAVRVYDLRHRFASAALIRWLDAGQDLYTKLPYLRSYMGHTHLNETLYYVHLLPENLVKSPGIEWEGFDKMIPEVMVCPE